MSARNSRTSTRAYFQHSRHGIRIYGGPELAFRTMETIQLDSLAHGLGYTHVSVAKLERQIHLLKLAPFKFCRQFPVKMKTCSLRVRILKAVERVIHFFPDLVGPE